MIPEIEFKSIDEIKKFQETKLKELLSYVSNNSTYYKNIFSKNKIEINQISTLEDLQKIPVTTKENLQENNIDFLCVPKKKIIDYVTTSGTTGDPVFFGLTDKDLDRLAYNEAISFICSNVTEEDTVQLMTTMDRKFMAGLAYFLGAKKLGAGIIRVGAGIPEMQWDSINKFNPTYIIAVPSFLLKLIDYAKKNGIDPNKSSIKAAICIGEPLKNQDFTGNVLSDKIKAEWNIDLYSTYASTEMNTAFAECEFQQGGHLHPELIIIEILDENDELVAPGEVGELVVTTLGVEGMPLLRFKTGDLLRSHTEGCECGRNTLRLGPVVGRKKQMIKYKGTTIYPPVMYDLLNEYTEIEHYVIVVDRNEIGTDEITIKLHSTDESKDFTNEIKDHFRAKLRVAPTIQYITEKEIKGLKFPVMSRKPVILIDKRKQAIATK